MAMVDDKPKNCKVKYLSRVKFTFIVLGSNCQKREKEKKTIEIQPAITSLTSYYVLFSGEVTYSFIILH